MTATGYTGGDPSKVDIDGYTKGDLLAANTTGVLTAIPVGVDGLILTADSADTEGVDWQAGGGAGTPSGTVVTETTFGQASTAGVVATYSRGDHTHGTPAAPATIVPATTVVTETSFGQASAVGTGVLYARDDHTHGTPTAPTIPAAATTVVTETSFGQASTVGVDAIYARQDHTHGTPAAPSVPSAAGTVVTETTFGQASAAGAAATFSRGDHTHGTPSLTAASAVVAETTFTQTSAVGVSTNYARQDHTHGTPGLVVKSGYIDTGNINTNVGGATWTALGVTGMSIPAVVGDYVEFTIGLMHNSPNFIDAVTKASGVIFRYMGSGTTSSVLSGSLWFHPDPNLYRTAAPPFAFVVAAGDLTGSDVIFDMAASGSGAGTIFANTNGKVFWRAINYGTVTVAP